MIGEPGRYDPAVFDGQPGGGDDIEWFRLRLHELGVEAHIDYRGRRVCLGEPLPETDAADAVVLGGSYHSVHENRPWQDATAAWLRAYRETARPLLAICGGHQLVARMHGAPVAPLDAAAAGSFAVALTDAGRGHHLFEGFTGRPEFHFANLEQVSAAPPGARILAREPRMPCAALDYGGGWTSVQFHPEASHDCLTVSWKAEAPTLVTSYRPLPEAPRLIHNFLVGAKLLQ